MCANRTILWLVKLRHIQVPSRTALTVKVQWPSHSLQWDLEKNELFDNEQEPTEVDNVCISRLHGWVLPAIQSWWMESPLVWKWKSRYHCLHPSEQRSQEFCVLSLFPCIVTGNAYFRWYSFPETKSDNSSQGTIVYSYETSYQCDGYNEGIFTHLYSSPS